MDTTGDPTMTMEELEHVMLVAREHNFRPMRLNENPHEYALDLAAHVVEKAKPGKRS